MSLFQLGHAKTPDFADPIGMLEACHRRIEKHLAIAAKAAAALRDPAQVLEARRALRVVLVYFDGPAVTHALDEDASLFPRLQHPALHDLTAEHREHEAIYLAMRTVARKLADEGTEPSGELIDELETHLRALAQAYGEHITREETEIFPLARALDAKEQRAMGIEMRIRRGGKND